MSANLSDRILTYLYQDARSIGRDNRVPRSELSRAFGPDEQALSSGLSDLVRKGYIDEQDNTYAITTAGSKIEESRQSPSSSSPPTPTIPVDEKKPDNSIGYIVAIIIAIAVIGSWMNSRNPGSDSTPGVPAPEQVVRDYYAAVARRDYGTAWSRLDGHFKDPANRCATYSDYEKAWVGISDITINQMNLEYQKDATARVIVDISYSGAPQPITRDSNFIIDLIWDSATNQWFFSGSSPLPTTKRYCP